MTNNRISGFRNVLNGGAASLAIGVALLSAGAWGQVAASSQPAPQLNAPGTTGAQTSDANPAATDTIIVTGTRIRNPNLASAVPENITNSNEIDLRQANVAEDLLREIPGIVPNIGQTVNNGNAGVSQVDLRGQGANRNLVLLDSGRIVPSTLTGVTDLNNIPLALIDRVDVVTGGASVSYGADAVTGVVNFVTKKNFTGIDFTTSQQITERGDAHVERADLTVGGNFADDKGNAVVSIGYQKADPLYQSDRDISTTAYDSFSGRIAGSGRTVPSRFALPGLGYQAINPDTGALQGPYTPFNFNPYNVFQTPFKRYNVFAQANYKASDAFEVYTRGLFTKSITDTVIAPSGVFDDPVRIPLDNPYLPAAARNQFCAASPIFNAAGTQVNLSAPDAKGNRTTIPLPTAQCNAAALATGPNDARYLTVNPNTRRRITEAGSRISDYTNTTFDYRLGIRGALGEHLHYDIYGDYGETEVRQNILNYIGVSKVRQAALASNTTTCFDPTGGCVPVNLFGGPGSISAAQVAFLTEQGTTSIRSSLAQAGGLLNGDVGFASPAATTPINFAIGAEYREYRATQLADQLSQTPGELGGGTTTIPFHGGYNVVEGFGQLTAPLIEDKPFFKSLTAEAGIRYSSYTVQGGAGYNTTTYNGGATWEPAKGFRFRGNYERAVRAPNINELFLPNTPGLTNLQVDPCSGTKPVGNAVLTAVCELQGAPASQIGAIEDPAASGGQVASTNRGSTNLKPERADTFTAGIILQPAQIIPRFSLSVDYYNIDIKDAITVATPQDVINACFNALSVTNAACSTAGISRDPATGSLAGSASTTPGLIQPFTNAGRIKTDGIDLSINYDHEVGPFKAAFGFTGNYTFHAKFQASPSSVNRECTSYYSVNCDAITGSLQPKYQWSQRTTLSYEVMDLSLLWRHISPFNQEPLDANPANSGPAFTGAIPGFPGTQNFGHIGAYDYFDLSVRFNLTRNLVFEVLAQNLTDNAPPFVGYNIGATAFNSGNTFPSTYDPFGRRYSATVHLKF